MAKSKYILTEIQKKVASQLEEKLKNFPRYIIEIGIFEGNNTTDYINKKGEIAQQSKKRENESDLSKEVTNSQIMYIMEYGSSTLDIPERPVLHQTVEWAKENLLEQTIEKGLDAYFRTNNIEAFELEVQKMCRRMENHVKVGIRRKQFDIAPNAQSTIDAKGSDIPLLDTGQLANSIQCVYRKIY